MFVYPRTHHPNFKHFRVRRKPLATPTSANPTNKSRTCSASQASTNSMITGNHVTSTHLHQHIDGIDKLDTPPLHQLKPTVHITTADLKFSQTYTTSPRQAQKATETLIIKTSSLSTQQQALTTNFPTQPARRRKNSRNAAPAAPKLGPDLTIVCTPPIISTRPT